MQEGSLEAPTRHPIAWQDDEFYDPDLLDAELRRVFDICHGCRRCFNLCDSFPQLFDLIDDSETEMVEDLPSESFKPVVDACTLCDMCFMVKCPYVPPHDFDLDFPHLMLRARAIEHKKGETKFADRELAKTDRNGKLATKVSGLANWATKESNGLTRSAMEKTLGIDKRAHLPRYDSKQFSKTPAKAMPAVNLEAPNFGRKAAIYATCYANFNDSTPGRAALDVLSHNGVSCRIDHPHCCGMPLLENGDLAGVAKSAEAVAAHFGPLIDRGYDIVALTPSCALMLKFEWPLILPDNPTVQKLAEHTRDLAQYVVELAKDKGLVEVPEMASRIGLHFACHSRAQNIGAKAMEMLKLIPGATPTIVERCSGHGGKWGIMADNYDTAVKLARPTVRNLKKGNPDYVVSECPLAGPHLREVMKASGGEDVPERVGHPIELVAKAYGF
ncbi:heterodisulfide reductase-related iron-sulfur binding cluster [Parasphingopyxis lamellibrachiae]|uniref:Fe-S oxidoreductase n=1 Tax=Parasphingopyxis lamellibrachiae TaxID=680125 RepID=A0A3D9FIG3_9SPHN|nr:heterodisulfide reductase-related iron-sulfur binding cluster [Parasphingopyxis lamellibrachiae]RED16876.1 Fe-S oxidoreductase [Parasphingopyxis lamellibrachiae]